MLRQQTITKIEYQRELMPLLHRMAALPYSDSRHINISDNVLRALDSETYHFSQQWINNGSINHTSRSKYSFVYAERLSSKRYFELLRQIKSFKQYLNRHTKSSQLYGYILTVNPRKLRYKSVPKLNRLVINNLKRNAATALIQKEVENTYCHAANNIHIHYVIVATAPLNQRKMTRAAKRYGKRTTNSVTAVNVERINAWRGAVSYVTKQSGLPLPLKDNQFKRFMSLPIEKRMALIADDINESKGVERHRFYVNSANAAAKSWHSTIMNEHYCFKHGVLVKPQHNKQLTLNNCSLTVFGCSFGKLYPNAHKPTSKHHYSQHEQLMQLYHHNIYYHCSNHAKQTSLF